MFFGVVCSGCMIFFGNCSWIVCVMIGIVIRKMISNISIMLMSGVVLMFVIILLFLFCLMFMFIVCFC